MILFIFNDELILSILSDVYFILGSRNRYRKYRTNYARDLDQIHEDIKKAKEISDETILKIQEWNEDLPGFGQYYCIPCA